MDRKQIEELMHDADYVYGASQNLQGVPLTDNNIGIIYNIQQLMKNMFIELKNELDSLPEEDKKSEIVECEKEIEVTVDQSDVFCAEENKEDVSEDA